VVDDDGRPVVGAPVRALHPSDGQCGSYEVELGSTELPNIVHAALPFGDWTFESGTATTPQLLDPTTLDVIIVTITVE
jgi:hypothetical protein